MTFWWWDDAVAHAQAFSQQTRIRHRVFADGFGQWRVEPVTDRATFVPARYPHRVSITRRLLGVLR